MKNTKRILCAVLAVAMVLSVMLTGCDRPKVTINKVPAVAATYGDGQQLTTGEYLAYLYLTFENTYNSAYEYYNQYAAYTGTYTDPLTQTYTYEEGGEEMSFYDYVVRLTQDNIKAQIILNQMIKDNGLSWDADGLSDYNQTVAELQKDAFIDLGFNNESYTSALKSLTLSWDSAFYGMYGEGGKHAKAVTSEELKNYFDTNYVSYKMLNIALTDSNSKALDKEGEAYKKLMELMDGYMKVYEEEGFDAAYEAFEKDADTIESIKESAATTTTTTTTTTGTGSTTAASGNTTAGTTAATTTTTASTTTTTSTDDTTTTTGTTAATEEEEEEHNHEHRVDVDSSTMDEALKNAIKGKKDADGNWEIEEIPVGECKIVEVESGEVLYAVMIERLDPYKDEEGNDSTLFEDSKKDIIYTLKNEDFTTELQDAVDTLKITFDKKVVDKCRPEDFVEEE